MSSDLGFALASIDEVPEIGNHFHFLISMFVLDPHVACHALMPVIFSDMALQVFRRLRKAECSEASTRFAQRS